MWYVEPGVTKVATTIRQWAFSPSVLTTSSHYSDQQGQLNRLVITLGLLVLHKTPQKSDRNLHGGLGRDTESWNLHVHFNPHF